MFSAVSAFGGNRYIYIDSSAGHGGTGSLQSPYNEFRDINWKRGGEKSVADWVASGEDVHIRLKRGKKWNERLLVNTSGSKMHPIIVEPYGSGAKPIIDGERRRICITIDHKKYITVDSIHLIKSVNIPFQVMVSNNILIKNCFFKNGTAGIAIVAENRIDAHNITIENCSFTGQTNLGVRGIVKGWGNQAGSSDGTIHSLSVNNCTFENLVGAIGFNGDKAKVTGHGGISPYRIMISNNLIRNTKKAAIVMNVGLRPKSGRSFIQNNRFINIGSPDVGHVNALQLNWCRGLTVQDNVIDTVRTNHPDGNGIILDYAWKDDNYITDGVIVRRNIIRNCRAKGEGKGIGVWKASNSKIYGNLISNCTIGIKISNNQSIGTKSYNNTIVNCTKGVVALHVNGHTSFRNNILYKSSEVGFQAFNTPSLTLNNNCVFGSGVANYKGVTKGNKSIEQNPLFVNAANSNYQLSMNSPCIDSGTNPGFISSDILGNPVPVNGTNDMGAYEYNDGQGGHQSLSTVKNFRKEN